MALKVSSSIDYDTDRNELLDVFLSRKPEVFHNFLTILNKTQLWKKLADTAIENRLLRPQIKSKITSSQNGALELIYELNRVNCTVGQLFKSMLGHQFQRLSNIFGFYEKLYVVKQPGESDTPSQVALGKEFKLFYLVEGYPYPTYQWYHNESPVKDATESMLILKNFRKEMEGKYNCVAEQSGSNLPDTKHTMISDTVTCVLLLYKPRFVENLAPEIVCVENQMVKLVVKPEDHLDVSYEWMYSNQIINLNSNEFVIPQAHPQHSGSYKCIIKNSAGETCSNVCYLKVERSATCELSAKLALLIGNSEYTNFTQLRTPSQDVKLLSLCLRKMGFSVISVINLSVIELRNLLSWFCSIIPKKSFVFFYFSGHGFELFNNKFLMPVDCPPSNNYKMSDCVCDQFIIKNIISKKPLLFVSVLDMCLRVPERSINPDIYCENVEHFDYDSTHTGIIQACATSDYQLAFESKKEENGLYCRCLSDYIARDMPASENFCDAHNEFGRKSSSNQKPQLTFNDQKKFKLCAKPTKDMKFGSRLNELFTIKPEIVKVNFKEIGINLILKIIPHDHYILNSIDVYILFDVRDLKFSLICPEVDYIYVRKSMTKINDQPLRLTINGIQKIKDHMTLHFSCVKYCAIKNRFINDFARFTIKSPLLSKLGLSI